jgi:hypothetical protein
MEAMNRWVLHGLVAMLLGAAPLSAQDAEPAAPPAAAPAVAPAPAVAADPTALLKAIPDDAVAFVAIRNLKELDNDVQGLAQQLQLPPGTIPSLLGWARDSLKLGQGLDETGSLALVLLNPGEAKTADELTQRLVVYIPATDSEALATAMGARKEGETLTLELMGQPSTAATRPHFLVVAQSPEAAKAAAQARGQGLLKALSPDRQTAWGQQDFFAWASFRGVTPEMRTEIQTALQQAMNEMGGPMMAGQLQGPVDKLNQLFEEGQEASVAASLEPAKGLRLSFTVEMKRDTELGRQMAAMKPVNGSLLIGLPNEPFIAALGSVATPDAEKQLRDAFDQVAASVGQEIDPQKRDAIKESLVKLLAGVEQMTIGVSGLPAQGQDGMIGVTFAAKVKNSQQWKAEAQKAFDLLKEVIVNAAKGEAEAETQAEVTKVADAVQWKPAAGGGGVDQIVVDLAQIPDVGPETIEDVKQVVGQEGILIRVAAVDPQHVLVTFGGGVSRFEKVADLVRKGATPLDDHRTLKAVADRLPAGPKLAEGYLNIDQLLALVTEIGNQLGGGLPFPFALNNAAPLAFTSVKAGETGQRMELLVPTELMRAVADLARPFLMMGLGGPGGGMPEEPLPPDQESGLE